MAVSHSFEFKKSLGMVTQNEMRKQTTRRPLTRTRLTNENALTHKASTTLVGKRTRGSEDGEIKVSIFPLYLFCVYPVPTFPCLVLMSIPNGLLTIFTL